MDLTWLEWSVGCGPHDGQSARAREDFDQVALDIRREMAGDNKGHMKVSRNLCKKGIKGFHSPCRTTYNGNREFFRVRVAFSS